MIQVKVSGFASAFGKPVSGKVPGHSPPIWRRGRRPFSRWRIRIICREHLHEAADTFKLVGLVELSELCRKAARRSPRQEVLRWWKYPDPEQRVGMRERERGGYAEDDDRG